MAVGPGPPPPPPPPVTDPGQGDSMDLCADDNQDQKPSNGGTCKGNRNKLGQDSIILDKQNY